MGLKNACEEEDEEEVAERMEWEKQYHHHHQQQQQHGVFYVKVMTDEQMELLRRQISDYATICEQLVQMHKSITAQQDSLAGMRLGNMYCDTLMLSGGQKITARQRWTPSPMQFQILESIFDQGNGTPTRQRIKEITSELTQHGPISETNVSNWFQNRRARSKRKQLVPLPYNAESKAEMEIESPKEKKAKAEINVHSHENPHSRGDELCIGSLEASSEANSLDPQPNKYRGTLQSSDCSKSSGNLSHISFFENMMSNPRMENQMGKIEGPGSFNPFRACEDYDIIG